MASTVTLESLSLQISTDDPIQFPDTLSLESFSFQVQAIEATEIYNVKQYAGGNGNYLSRSSASAYSLDLNPTSNATLQAAIDATGIVTTGTSVFTAADIEELASLPDWNRTYFVPSDPADLNTNMSKLTTGELEIYTNNAPDQTLVKGKIKTITSAGGGREIKFTPIPCSLWGAKLLKFKNLQGGVEYLFFYQKDSKKSNISDSVYLQFDDGYKNANGDTQREFTVWRDDLPSELAATIEALDNNQNVWFSDDWQMADFANNVTAQPSVQLPLEANERLLRMDLTMAQYKILLSRFNVGDKITLLDDENQVLLGMFGYVAQLSKNDGSPFILFKFDGYSGNDDLVILDNFVSDGTELKVVAYDAWELCTVSNLTKYETKKDKLFVQVSLVTQPEKNYKV